MCHQENATKHGQPIEIEYDPVSEDLGHAQVDCSDFYDSDYLNNDDNLYDKSIDHDFEWLGVKEKGKRIEGVNEYISEKMYTSTQDEDGESHCVVR